MLWKLGRKDEALADYSRAVDLNRADQIFIYKRFQANVDLGRYQEALKDVDAAIALVPGNSFYIAHKARLLIRMGKKTEARSLLETFGKNQPLDGELESILKETE